VSKRNKQDEIAISERELNAMTAELDMLHKETFPGVTKTLAEFKANLSHLRTSEKPTARRSFLMGVGGVAVLGGVAACSSSGGSSAPSSQATTPAAPQSSGGGGGSKYTGDLLVVALAAALENLAVAATSWVPFHRQSPPSPPRRWRSTRTTRPAGTRC
jgi:hypothetical protein